MAEAGTVRWLLGAAGIRSSGARMHHHHSLSSIRLAASRSFLLLMVWRQVLCLHHPSRQMPELLAHSYQRAV